eukprot:RCo030988
MARIGAVASIAMSQVCLDLSQLEAVFDELAPDGQLPRESLVQLVRRLTVSSGEAFMEIELEEALGDIRVRCPDRPFTPDFLTLDEARDVVQLLCETETHRPDSGEETVEGRPRIAQELSGGKAGRALQWVFRTASALWACVRRSRNGDEVYENRMKPTTKLVISVVVMSLVMALAVAGTAIGLNWSNTMAMKEEELLEELANMHHALDSFAVTQARQKVLSNQLSTTFMLSAIVEQVGYNVNLRTTQAHQLNAAEATARVVGGLFDGVSLDRSLTRVAM